MVAAEAPSNLYGEDALRANLRSLEWVSRVAVMHEAVVEHFAAMPGATVVPMKLLTLFSSEEAALAELRRRRTAIGATIRKIAGCEEWGVRIFAHVAATEAAGASRRVGKRPAVTTGAAFLAGRKAARDAAQLTRARAIEAAERTFDELAGLSRSSRLHQRVPGPGGHAPLVDAAFLVKTAMRVKFKAAVRAQVRACAVAGARLTLSGPWQAYNFVGDPGETK
jgi:hypothetical protein